MTGRLAERVNRLEQALARVGATDTSIPPWMMKILLYGLAVHVGGYPAPVGTAGMYLKDSVGDAIARAFGYADGDDARARMESEGDWSDRLDAAVGTLFERVGLHQAAGPDEAFVAMARMLNDYAAAKSTLGEPRDWKPLSDDLDYWARQAGYSPEALRSEARQ